MGAVLKVLDSVLFVSFVVHRAIGRLSDGRGASLFHGIALAGASLFSAMAAITAELIRSNRASDILVKLYLPFLGLGVLATLRGLLPPRCSKATATGHRPRKSATKRKLEEKKLL